MSLMMGLMRQSQSPNSIGFSRSGRAGNSTRPPDPWPSPAICCPPNWGIPRSRPWWTCPSSPPPSRPCPRPPMSWRSLAPCKARLPPWSPPCWARTWWHTPPCSARVSPRTLSCWARMPPKTLSCWARSPLRSSPCSARSWWQTGTCWARSPCARLASSSSSWSRWSTPSFQRPAEAFQ